MPIVQTLRYELPEKIHDLESGTDAIRVLRTVKNELSHLDSRLSEKPLLDILSIVEKGTHLVPSSNSVVTEISIGEVHGLFNGYRLLSEGGCFSCRYYVSSKKSFNIGRHVKPLQIHCTYCSLHDKEREKSVKEYEYVSPTIGQFNEKGCPQINRKLPKIEEVLAGLD